MGSPVADFDALRANSGFTENGELTKTPLDSAQPIRILAVRLERFDYGGDATEEAMNKRDSRKLSLSKETVRRLGQQDLRRIAGGTADPCTSGDPRCTCPSFVDTYDCTVDCQPCTSGDPRCTCPSFI